ncbi:MAG: vitamin K epoxide reductase family protein [Actinobacteria bacterium]|nr:vitamin K epoxide reductase family protein [Actinomycetota bacterium]
MTAPGDLLDRIYRFRQTDTWIFSTMLFSACLSLYASFVLATDAIRLAADPKVGLPCNLNEVINCSAVARSWQAGLFGFPNAFLGLMAEPVVITIAVASLAGVRFPRGFMFASQLVYGLGFVFAYWLFFESTFVIGALCPWCLLVTVSTTLVFASLTHVNLRDNNVFLPRRAHAVLTTGLRLGVDSLLVVLWLGAITTLVLAKYGAALVQ